MGGEGLGGDREAGRGGGQNLEKKGGVGPICQLWSYVEKKVAILVAILACCLNNLYDCCASLQTFLNFLIMKKQISNKTIHKIFSSTISKSSKKKGKRNSPRFWIRPAQTSSWWDNFLHRLESL